MTYRDHSITTETPAIYAIDATIDRMLRACTRQDAENLLPLDAANDDLIQERIRRRLGECRKMLAHWIGFGVDNGRYEIMGLPWYSHNGDHWYEQGTDNLIDSDDFYASTITLIGGARNGEVIR